MKRKSLALLMVFLMTLGSFTACKSSNKETASNNTPDSTVAVDQVLTPYGKYAAPVTITTGRSDIQNAFTNGDTLDNNAWLKYIKDKVNVEVKNEWLTPQNDTNAAAQKIALVLASGNMPDVLVVNRQTLLQLNDSGMIADLTSIYNKVASPVIKDYYNSFNGSNMAMATIGGKLMAIPNCNIGGQQDMLWVRKDWLDKLGLQMPKTLNDIKNVAKAFITKDPDGNGKDDTVGIPCSPLVGGQYNSVHNMNVIFGNFGAYPRQWIKDKSGKVIYGSTAPEMKLALTELASMYKEGLIDKQFAVRGADVDQIVANNQTGLVFGPWWIPYWPLNSSVKNNPKADWKPVLAPVDSNGDVHLASQDPAGSYLVVSTKCKNPEAVMKVLNLEYDALKLFDKSVLKTIPYFDPVTESCKVSWTTIPIVLQIGYEDDVNRFYKQLSAAVKAKDPSLIQGWYKSTYDNVLKNMANPGADDAVWADAVARMDGQALAYDPHVKLNRPVFFGTTATMETKWAALKKMEDEMMLKIVMGQEPIDSFDKFVNDWNNLGGKDIANEVVKSISK